MEEVSIPRYIDDQQQFFFWEMDEAAVAITIFGIGIAVGAVIWSIIVLYFVSKQLGSFKNNTLPGALLHMAYWGGITGLNSAHKDAFVKDFYA